MVNSFGAHQLSRATQTSQQVAKNLYESKVQPTTLIPKQVGNMYTASLYAAFASVIHNRHETLVRYYLQFVLLLLQDQGDQFRCKLGNDLTVFDTSRQVRGSLCFPMEVA
jgi:hypothetical protein